MVEHRLVGVEALVAAPLHPHAPVGVVGRQVEERVPEANLLDHPPRHQHRATADVGHFLGAVVLPLVELPEAALLAGRLAESQVAARRPEPVAVGVVVDLRPDDADPRVALDDPHQLGQHPGVGLDVVVEQ